MAKKPEINWSQKISFDKMVRVYLAARKFLDCKSLEDQIEARAKLLIECDMVRDHLTPPKNLIEGL